jgi:hypothetical protein
MASASRTGGPCHDDLELDVVSLVTALMVGSCGLAGIGSRPHRSFSVYGFPRPVGGTRGGCVDARGVRRSWEWNARGIALAADMFAPISRALHAM